ncbi:MAG: hypothetical protein GVY30_06275 [Chloroflexi bacterium]|jgi:predicted nucleic acid-binding protein|nr:hypothetical protein [Chloroflexota bacterium]
MNLEPVFVDTWGWMALGHRREPRHEKVQACYRKLRAQQIPIYTSDYVLDELITLLFRRENFTDSGDLEAERQEKPLSLPQNLLKRVQGKRSWG